MPKNISVATDYEYGQTHKRDRLTLWSGQFCDQYEGDAFSLPQRDGYMVTLYGGRKIRVVCPFPRDESNYLAVDEAINDAIKKASAENG